MTINKAQGQTMKYVGIFLPQPVFSHGQLYVALSRVSSEREICIMVEGEKYKCSDKTFTKNVVYNEIFDCGNNNDNDDNDVENNDDTGKDYDIINNINNINNINSS